MVSAIESFHCISLSSHKNIWHIESFPGIFSPKQILKKKVGKRQKFYIVEWLDHCTRYHATFTKAELLQAIFRVCKPLMPLENKMPRNTSIEKTLYLACWLSFNRTNFTFCLFNWWQAVGRFHVECFGIKSHSRYWRHSKSKIFSFELLRPHMISW